MFVKIFIEEIKNLSLRTRWKNKTGAVFLCDCCGKEIITFKNIKRKQKRELHFCNRNCSNLSRKNGILKERYAKNCLKQYGVEHFSQRKDVKNKRKNTFIEKHNVKNPSQLENIKNKKSETCYKNYGVKNVFRLTSKRYIKELNIHLKDWLLLQPDPKPTFESITKIFPNETISLQEIQNHLRNYKTNKTHLEFFTENLFGIKHFNKKPKEIKKHYRPDFKLSNNIYVNVDGIYWHTETYKNKWDHFNLRKDFEEAGLKILQFYNYEIYNKTDIVKSIIDLYANVKNVFKINIKDCETNFIDFVKVEKFIYKNSLKMNIINDSLNVGVFYGGKLVSCLSYKIIDNVCIIQNWCTMLNIIVKNAFPSLLKFILTQTTKIQIKQFNVWIDLRYENDEELISEGFVKIKDELKYFWTDNKKLYNSNFKNKMCKIYDAGQRLYVKKLT